MDSKQQITLRAPDDWHIHLRDGTALARTVGDDHAPSLSDRARLVKLADKTANLRDVATAPPDGWPVSRLEGYLDWGKAVIDNIRGSHAQLEALFDEAYAQGKATVKAMRELD